jgi:thiamine kinase-like enzyme
VAEAEGEEVLHGGNTSVVMRAGDTVRRQTGHWTPAVHALLRYLDSADFGDAPKVLCLDNQGREVLLFVEGEVGLRDHDHPLPPWFRTAEACRAIGDWLRRFHEAQYGFTPDPALPWRMVPGRPLTRGEVVVHHDAAPYNTIQRPFGGLTVIDWDFCAPGDPIEDLAFAAWQWVPLWADRTAVEHAQGRAMTVQDAGTKLAALAEGYHASVDQRWTLVDACVTRMTRHADGLEAMAATDPAFARLVDLGIASNARLDAEWVRENEAVLSAAVRG